jgi:hypothetical protein
MKKLLFSLIVLASLQTQAQKYFTKTGTVIFNSKSPVEKIEGVNKATACLLDTRTGAIDFIVQIKSFVFDKQLMQEHFNENYLESDKFPKANFKGVISNLSAINFAKDGDNNAEVAGKMTLHGVTKDVKFAGKISVKSGKITITSTPILLLADYKIAIPNAVKDKVSKDVKITVNTTLDLMK